MSKPKMKKEHDGYFDMEGAQGAFRIAKKDLSPEMLKRIRGYAHGDAVPDTEGGGYIDPLTAMERKYTPAPQGVLYDSEGNPVVIPQAPESGTATYQVGANLPEAVPTRTEFEQKTGEYKPMHMETPEDRLAAGTETGADKIRRAQSEHLAELRAAPDPRQAAVNFQKKKEELGVVPKDSPAGEAALKPPEQQIAPPAAPTAPAQRPSGGGLPGTKEFVAGMGEMQKGITADAEAQKAKAVATVNALDAAQKQAQANALEAKKRTDAAMQQSQERLSKLDAAITEMKNVNTTVDPGRYWASRSTPQRILGIFGLALGALGAGKDGINRAAQMLQAAIDRDVEAQKAEVQARLAKGRGNVEGAQSAYAASHQIFQDEVAATNAAKAASWELADNELKKIAAGSMGPEAAARAQQLSGEIQARVGQYKRDTGRMSAELALQAQAKANSGVDAKQQGQLFELGEREREIQQSGARLLSLLDKYGTQEKYEPGVEAEMNQAINGMIIASAKMQDREGVVREPDEARERKSLGFEPGFFQRTDAAKAAITSYMQNAERRRNNALAVRGLR